MSTKVDDFEIVICGPSLSTKGGISSVLSIYKENLSIDFNMKFISTYSGGNLLKNLLSFISAIIKVMYICAFGDRKTIFHFHTSQNGSFLRKYILSSFCLLFNKKVIMHVHGSDFDKFILNSNKFVYNRIIKLLNKVDIIIVLSASWKQFFNQYVENQNKVVIVYNPSKKIKDEYTLKQNMIPTFLFMGRIDVRKGAYDLFEAVKKTKGTDFKLEIYGDGESEKFKQLYKTEGLADKVTVNGWVNHNEVIPIYDRCDCLILPSYAEGLPMSILEAAGRGLPIISTDVGGITEAVIDGENGFVIKPGDIEQLTNCIVYVATDASLREKMGRRSLSIAKEKFSIPILKDNLKIIYVELNV